MSAGTRILRRIGADEVAALRSSPVDRRLIPRVEELVAAVRDEGEPRLRSLAAEFDGLSGDAPLWWDAAALAMARERLPTEQRALLERTAERIRGFAQRQRDCLRELEVAVPGGRAGHQIDAVPSAGCYAPGGRYPLPSSVLMTACVARVAGVDTVAVASPRPSPVTLAAAAVAGADGLLAAGGAHAIAALAHGVVAPRCELIAGPGNAWVTAAKHVVSQVTRIDMLAGPTELVVIADRHANAAWVAADLLAQAEHDAVALPILIAIGEGLVEAVDAELARQLASLPTAEVARAALAQGFAVEVADREAAVELGDRLAAEHVALHVEDPRELSLRHGGAFFRGERSAEVFGDYGVGPNHVLPTGGSARGQGGLSVFSFLKLHSWLEMDEGEEAEAIAADAAALARLEGLEGHARAAECRAPRISRIE